MASDLESMESDAMSIYFAEPETYQTTVTREDVMTLKNDWLTDNVIAFWEEYARLAHNHFLSS